MPTVKRASPSGASVAPPSDPGKHARSQATSGRCESTSARDSGAVRSASHGVRRACGAMPRHPQEGGLRPPPVRRWMTPVSTTSRLSPRRFGTSSSCVRHPRPSPNRPSASSSRRARSAPRPSGPAERAPTSSHGSNTRSRPTPTRPRGRPLRGVHAGPPPQPREQDSHPHPLRAPDPVRLHPQALLLAQPGRAKVQQAGEVAPSPRILGGPRRSAPESPRRHPLPHRRGRQASPPEEHRR